jgi:bifunctional DNA-binding transcriptional regulator/antitoxin component of YhaV-PrlF toxin-antitoxin module
MNILKQIEYRKVQGLVGEQSFSIVLPKSYAVNLGIGKGDFVKVYKEEEKIIVEKA